MSGFLSGTFLGGVIGAVLIFVSSQTLERQSLSFPKPEAAAVEVPAGTEFDQARPETDPVLPETETRPEAEAVAGVPDPDELPDAPPALDTSALEVPTPEVEAPDALETVTVDEGDAPTAPGAESATETGAVSDLSTPEAPGAAPDAEAQTPFVATAPAEDDAPRAGVEETAPQVDTETAALPQTQADTGSSAGDTAPAVISEDTAPVAPAAPEIGTESALPTPQVAEEAPQVTEEPAIALLEDEAEQELPSFLRPVEDLENSGDVETDRLPQVNAQAEPEETTQEAALPTILRPGSEVEAAEETEAEDTTDAAEEDPAALEGLPALQRHAVAFENPEGAPLISVVLVSQGAALTQAQLDELPPFLAFGVEAGAPDAAQVAAQYRAAGREVVMIPSLPQGATPQDVEQALRVNFETVTEAVAVMDVSGESFQSDREAVSQIVDVVADSGHGLITYPRGLNNAHQRATRAGVATGLIFRQLDGSGEDAAQIQRTMDRAAFRARQDEAVILVGTTNSTTLIALVEWALGSRAQSVTLAPISAALVGGG